MIACLLSDIEADELAVEGDSFLHLNNSLRVKVGDKVLAMNGMGLIRETVVQELKKKSLILAGGVPVTSDRGILVDVILSPPKRDALNDCLRMACEIGVRNIYFYSSEYCQNRKLDIERANKVLRSSVIQSNNPYLPKLFKIENLKAVTADYENKIILHLCDEENLEDFTVNATKEQLLIIGPEGGFSANDINLFESHFEKVSKIKLPTPILRTATALCVAFGKVLRNP